MKYKVTVAIEDEACDKCTRYQRHRAIYEQEVDVLDIAALAGLVNGIEAGIGPLIEAARRLPGEGLPR